MTDRRRIRPVLLSRVAPATLAVALLLTPGLPASAATDGGVAWTVQTVDNANGAGRGNFAYDVQPGAVIVDAMTVTNTGTVPLPLSVYAADAFTASTGEIDVLTDGTPSQDAGTWVSVATPALDLAPGQAAEVAFTIAVPADARPGDHAAGIVSSFLSGDASQTLSVDRRLGTRINLRVAGDLVPAAELGDVDVSYTPSWNPFDAGTLTVSYAVRNSGNTRITATEAVTVGGPAGLFGTAEPAVQLGEIIPGSTVETSRQFPVSSLGWLTGSIAVAPEGVGLGAAGAAAIVTEFSVPAVPWSLLALLGLLAAAVVAVVLAVRRRRARPVAAASAPSPA